jgi:hypothetical protein
LGAVLYSAACLRSVSKKYQDNFLNGQGSHVWREHLNWLKLRSTWSRHGEYMANYSGLARLLSQLRFGRRCELFAGLNHLGEDGSDYGVKHAGV